MPLWSRKFYYHCYEQGVYDSSWSKEKFPWKQTFRESNETVEEILATFESQVYDLCINIQFLFSLLKHFLKNLEVVSDEQGECFHQVIKVMDNMFDAFISKCITYLVSVYMYHSEFQITLVQPGATKYDINNFWSWVAFSGCYLCWVLCGEDVSIILKPLFWSKLSIAIKLNTDLMGEKRIGFLDSSTKINSKKILHARHLLMPKIFSICVSNLMSYPGLKRCMLMKTSFM